MAMTTTPSYAADWKAIADRQDWDYVETAARARYAQPVDWRVAPTGLTIIAWEQYVTLRLWRHGATSDTAAYCLQVAWEQAQQATRADMFEHTGLEGEFPLNRLRFMKAKVFIEATRLGVPLDPASVNQIADDESAIAPTYGRHEWDAVAQSSYVQTIELLLLAGEFQRAQAMVDDARGMRGLHVKELFDNAKLLLKHPDAGHDSPEARLGYRSAFDLLRNPYYADHRKGHPAYTNQVLTMALMWQKFYEPGDGHYGLDRAIDLYWA